VKQTSLGAEERRQRGERGVERGVERGKGQGKVNKNPGPKFCMPTVPFSHPVGL
jgi:hypothetical protein